MALRVIRVYPDPILGKVSRPIENIDDKTRSIANDMIDTLHDITGYGLAAVQVGMLRRMVVIDLGEGPLVLINPELVASEETETGTEGCLSVPGYQGEVVRPVSVDLSYTNLDGERIEVAGITGLFKRALCHEIDHLDGILYVEKATNIYKVPAEGDEDYEEYGDEGEDASDGELVELDGAMETVPPALQVQEAFDSDFDMETLADSDLSGSLYELADPESGESE